MLHKNSHFLFFPVCSFPSFLVHPFPSPPPPGCWLFAADHYYFIAHRRQQQGEKNEEGQSHDNEEKDADKDKDSRQTLSCVAALGCNERTLQWGC